MCLVAREFYLMILYPKWSLRFFLTGAIGNNSLVWCNMNRANQSLAGVAVACLLAIPGLSADQKKAKPLSASEVFKRSVPGIVAIDCFGEDSKPIATASGFLVADNGKILTNVHVIAQCQTVSVRLSNGDTYDAPVVQEVDARKDLAMIRIKAVSLPFLTLGDSDKIEIGQTVYSIGNPKGLQNTLQQGLVSGFHQAVGYRAVQVSASINPGNSGGPVLDDQGRVIAVAMSKITDAENLGFAVPINYAKGFLDSKTDTPFAVFATAMRQAFANAAKTTGANNPPATGAVPGGSVESVPSSAPPPPTPSTATSLGAMTQPSLTFTTIETIAGKEWRFEAEGIDATRVPLSRCYGVAADKAGNVYATDWLNGAVVKIDTTGRMHILAGPDSAPANRPNYPFGIATDASGAVYFSESYRLRKILPNGDVTTVAGADKSGSSPDGAAAATAQVSNVRGIAFAKDGTVAFAESGNNRIRRIDAQGRLQTVAGDGQARFAGDMGPAGSASLSHPSDVAYDANGNLLVADQSNGRVRKITPDGKITTVMGPGVTKDVPGCPTGVATNSRSEIFVADPCKRQIFVLRNGESSIYGGTGTGLKEPSGQGSSATGASFDEWALAVNNKDELLISSPDFGHIYRIDRNGVFSIVAGAGNWRVPVDGTPAREAYFNRPNAIVLDAKGAILFTDSSAHRIYRIDEKRVVSKLAGAGRPMYSGEAVVAHDSEITSPLGLRVRSNGAILFVERGNQRIREIAPDGKMRTVAGNGRAEYAGDGGQAKNAALNNPEALAFDPAGNIYVSDRNNNRIRKIKTDGTIQLVAGDGTRGFSGDGGPAERASLNSPLGIEIGPDGSLYIADAGNHRIRKISNGTITTIAGDGSNRFAGDMGPALRASFMWPYALEFGPDRALYILDSNASRVRRIDPQSGVVTTVAGTGSRAVSGDGGPALQAGLGAPEGLAFDPAGNMYLAETTGKIRMIHAVLGAAAGTPPTYAIGNRPPAAFVPPQVVLSQNDAVISVSFDRMEKLLREKIGVWTTEEARTVLGTARTENGRELTFETPGTNFSRVTLAFSADKLDRVNFIPAEIVRWDRQLAYMRGKYPGDEFKAGQSGDNTVYTFTASRTSFTVLPDGRIVSMTIF
jgi:S1-C subfamily serine protease/sugar lactone lactonase YvrE